MFDQGPMPPMPLPPGGPLPPAGPPLGADPMMGGLPPAPALPPDPGADALAMVIADAIKSYQEGQAAEAVQHPVVQALLAPPADASRGMGGGALPPMPMGPDPSIVDPSMGGY